MKCYNKFNPSFSAFAFACSSLSPAEKEYDIYENCIHLTYGGYLWMSEACRGDAVVIHYMRSADDILNGRYPLSNAKHMLKIK